MRRVNIEAAFLGEGGVSDTGDEEGLALSVRGGEIVLVLPAGTPESRAVEAASILRGSLRLENGRVMTFEIHDGAVGAFFEDEPAELFDRREATPADGLSSVGARSAAPSFRGAEALHGASATARDVMTTSVVSVAPTDSVDEAARLLTFHDISGLPVCDPGGRVTGVVSEADLIGKSGATVGEVMTAPAVTIPESTSLEQVAHQLTEQRIRRLPVVDSQGTLVGIVSRHDILLWASRRAAVLSPQT